MSNLNRHPVKRGAVGVLAGTLAFTGYAIAAGASPANALPDFDFERLAGPDRYGTAAVIATDTFQTAPTVILASGATRNFPDALTGNYLAGEEQAPILLTDPNRLPRATSDALTSLQTRRVIIVGGTSAVSAAVENALKSRANTTVEREGGIDRYETAEKVAKRVGGGANQANVGEDSQGRRTAILGNGQDFPDILASGPISYAEQFPIAITRPTSLPATTRDVLEDLNIERVIIVGGTAAVSQAVQNEVDTFITDVDRIAGGQSANTGGTRFGTAVELAEFAYRDLGFDRAHVNLARGDDFADALAGGPHGGEDRSPIVLTFPNSLQPDTDRFLRRNCPTLVSGHIFGGTSAVSTGVENGAIAAARSCANPNPPSPSPSPSPSATPTATMSPSPQPETPTAAITLQRPARDITDTATTLTFTGVTAGNTVTVFCEVVGDNAGNENAGTEDTVFATSARDADAASGFQIRVEGLSPNTSYECVGTQTAPNGQRSPISNDVDFTTKPAPPVLREEFVSDSSTVLTVTNLAADATRVDVRCVRTGTTGTSPVDAFATTDQDASIAGFQVRVDGLSAGTTYNCTATQTTPGGGQSLVGPAEPVTTNRGPIIVTSSLVGDTGTVGQTSRPDGIVNRADSFTLTFDQNIATNTANPRIEIRDADGDVAVFRCVTGSTANTTDDLTDVNCVITGQTLRVQLLENAVDRNAEGDGAVEFPFLVVGVQGIVDADDGNAVDIANSRDRTVERSPAAPAA